MTVQGRPNPGMQQKPDDFETVPLCSACHREQHAGKETLFWQHRVIDPLGIAAQLALWSPDVQRMRNVIRDVRVLVMLGGRA